ncbi:hypothetical protein [Phenylobacterium sp.]|uniref:hypothetical protein n=1 Tax=Phenylobacterium sp. TaxID=1871053 RepID=UPI0025EABE82|nr:hypothetical protein [Phenylobacterium sp.]
MAKADEKPTPRVQVYFENPKTELALRREARANRMTLSRAAEQAISRGLQRRPAADPEDRLLSLDRALRDHMRATARDMTIVQELLVEFARAFFARLPDTAADQDPLLRAAVEARIGRLLDAAAARIVAGGTRTTDEATAAEPRSFSTAAE